MLSQMDKKEYLGQLVYIINQKTFFPEKKSCFYEIKTKDDVLKLLVQ